MKSGKLCKQMRNVLKADYDISGPNGNWGYCREFGWQLREFAQTWQCARGNLVGGQIKVNGDGANSGLILRWIRA